MDNNVCAMENSVVPELPRPLLVETIQRLMNELGKKEQGWDQLSLLMSSASKTASGKVVLDVGGERFATTTATLLRFPGGYFSALLMQTDAKCEDGSYFIDRNPEAFDIVLDYMRNGTISTSLDEKTLAKVEDHVNFFHLPTPPPLFKWDLLRISPSLTVKGRKVTKIHNNRRWGDAAYGDTPNPPSYRVRITRWWPGRPNNVMIGLAPQQSRKLAQYFNHGYFISAVDGMVYGEKISQHYHKAPIKDKAVVEVIYDKDRKTISFAIDGVSHGIAFTTSPIESTLYPVVEIQEKHVSVEFC